MKFLEKKRFRQRALIKPLACIALTVSAILASHTASAGLKVLMDGGVVWCNGDVVPIPQAPSYSPIPGYPADTMPVPVPNPMGLAGVPNPSPVPEAWKGDIILDNELMGDKAETITPTAPVSPNDRYAIQLNFWNSDVPKNGPSGYTPGNSCMLFYYNTGNIGQFTYSYPAPVSRKRDAEVTWHLANPRSYPTFVPYADFNTAPDPLDSTKTIDVSFKADNPTKGGPTGYISTFKGCSWDTNSCTQGSAVPTGAVTKPTDWNVFPVLFTDITSIPTQWTISNNATYGNAMAKTPYVAGQPQPQVWDASYDIWFDTTARTGEGKAPWGDTAGRGQNDGLEIMVWLNSNGSYVDGPLNNLGTGTAENPPGLAQPTGHIREKVYINGIFFDVWVGRLNNPYFSAPGGTIIGKDQSPNACPTLPGALCGTSWNVVSFVATKDGMNQDYRTNSMALDAKVFADYILGIQDGLWVSYAGWVPDPLHPNEYPAFKTADRAANEVLKCPASNMNQDLTAPTIACLQSNWYLTSIQAGFEPWVGGNGLQSDYFRAHVSTKSTGIQSGLVTDTGKPVIHWQTPFSVVSSDCSDYSASNHATFNITGFNSDNNNAPMTYPLDGSQKDMGAQNPTTKQFVYTVQEGLKPMHGDATIHIHATCNGGMTVLPVVDVPVFIDPSGRVFYSDGVTPVAGATVTLQYSPSGNQNGPFVAVPDHNKGLPSAIMQPNDNTQNPMKSTAQGVYAWNTAVGWYKVTASLANCGTVTTIARQVTVGHPVENLNINLPCAAPTPLPPPPPPSTGTPGVSVNLTLNGADSQHSYCRNIVLKNNNSYPVTWVVKFNLPFAGNIIQTWNLTYSKSGNTITGSGSASWNYVLAPGQTLNSSGFCATK